MIVALTRSVPASIVHCELTHVERAPIDVRKAARQHECYESALRKLGCRIERLPDEPSLSDSVFVEDIAVVVDEVAVIMRPGAASRRPETRSLEGALSSHRPLQRIEAPGTIDGGDVLRVGRRVFVGLSTRTNAAALAQLDSALTPLGYSIRSVDVRRCLHLKSAAVALTEDLLLLNPAWVDPSAFGGIRWLAVDANEPAAANVIALDEHVLCQQSAPRTAKRIEHAGFTVDRIDMSELAKAEGGLTCCSVIFQTPECEPKEE